MTVRLVCISQSCVLRLGYSELHPVSLLTGQIYSDATSHEYRCREDAQVDYRDGTNSVEMTLLI